MKLTPLHIILFFFTMSVGHLTVYAQKELIVAQDGKGDFVSIQEAINSLPLKSEQQRIIRIKKGVYKEKLFIKQNKLTLIGEGAVQTIITYSEARDIFRCSHPDDNGVATMNLEGDDIVLEGISVINSYGFDAKSDINIECATDTISHHKEIRKTGHQMALRSFGSTRLIVKNCIFRALGGDTVSPWNVESGMFYFYKCIFEGGVDFYCPRGWSLAEDCQFICHSNEAAIWHDGSKNKKSKTVLIHCSFKGDDGFKLGRYHRDAQFYLLNCYFPKNMADADIYQKQATPPNIIQWGKRVYYYNCHKEGGDFDWFKNNLPDSLDMNDINAAWVYDYKWNPKKDEFGGATLKSRGNGDEKDFIGDNMLLYQRKNGGWPKAFKGVKVDYKRALSDSDKAELLSGFESGIDATIDNDATTKEIRYMLKAYATTNQKQYLEAAERGIDYILNAQYSNGGWPQFYPDLSSYRNEITYNDNAMVNVLNVLQDIVEQKGNFNVPEISKYNGRAVSAIKKGIDCILKTQILRNGVPTVWCAQYNPTTLQPAMARKYELVSLSGAESVGIVRFLMRLPNPTLPMIDAVRNAVAWFKQVEIKGYDVVEIKAPQELSGKDKVLVKSDGSTIWARFYDITTNQPFFCGRDSQPKQHLSEIENERRVGYQWYGKWATKLLESEYPKWWRKYNKLNDNSKSNN